MAAVVQEQVPDPTPDEVDSVLNGEVEEKEGADPAGETTKKKKKKKKKSKSANTGKRGSPVRLPG